VRRARSTRATHPERMLLTPPGSRLRPAPARKSGGEAAIASPAAPFETPGRVAASAFRLAPGEGHDVRPREGPTATRQARRHDFPTGHRRHPPGLRPKSQARADTLRSAAAGPRTVGATFLSHRRFAQARRRCDRRGWSALPADIAGNGPLIHPGALAAERHAPRRRSDLPALPPSIRLAAAFRIEPGAGRNGGCCRYREPLRTVADAFACYSKA
jgi:hypothetical protein